MDKPVADSSPSSDSLAPESLLSRRNIRLVLQYDGGLYHGWQIQPRLETVQGVLTQAIRRITSEAIHIHGSGRTDAGTHALGQVCNFQTRSAIPAANLHKAINTLLPASLRVMQVEEVPLQFHARRDARWKHYRYWILNDRWCSPFDYPYVHHYPRRLDFAAMSQAAECVLGERDFTSFCDAKAEAESKVRRIMASSFVFDTRRQLIEYNVCADGFLHHMVRNLVGTFLEIGRGNWVVGDMERIFEAHQRTAAGPTAPAKGLFLMAVGYEAGYPPLAGNPVPLPGQGRVESGDGGIKL
jgi:tRNA pseudouridine38-40 synthase